MRNSQILLNYYYYQIFVQINMKFEPKSVVWAITIGQPIWPAYVEKEVKGQYRVKFFAESCTATISQFDMFDYLQNKQKYGGSTKNKKLIKAMQLAQKFIENKKKQTQKIMTNNKSHSKSKAGHLQSKSKQHKSNAIPQMIKAQFSSSQEYYKQELKNKETTQTKIQSNSNILLPVEHQHTEIITKKEVPCNKIYHVRNLEQKLSSNNMPKIEQIKQESLLLKNSKQNQIIEQKHILDCMSIPFKTQSFQAQKDRIRHNNRQIQQKLEEAMSIMYLQQKNPNQINYYPQIKSLVSQAIALYGDGLNIYGYFFTRIANLINFISMKLRQFNFSYFESEILFLENQFKRIQHIFNEHFFGIEEYKSYEKYHQTIKQQNQETITRPEAAFILLCQLKSFYKQKFSQEVLKKYALRIQEKIFESEEDYTKLVKAIQQKFQKNSEQLKGLNLQDLFEELYAQM